MLLQLIIAAVMSVGAPAGLDAPAPPDEAAAILEEAVGLLERELELLPAASPQRAGEDGFDEARRELQAVQLAGAVVLAELRDHGVALTPEIVRSLEGVAQGVPAAESKPPPLDTYASAIADLRQIIADRSAAAAAAPSAAPAMAPTVESSGESSGRSALVSAVMGLLAVAALLAAVLWLIRRNRTHLSAAMEEALTDPLTRLANRRRLDRDLGELEAGAEQRVAVLMVDVDHFKLFNDNHGHAVGDSVLQQVATLISMQIRSDDVVYRYGGEEFCVLLPGATVAEAHVIAERIRGCVGYVDAPPGARRLTVSIGLATDVSALTRSAIVDADAALLRAKQSGRDRTVLAAVTAS